MTDMESGSTSVGGILSAMVFQIEQDNAGSKRQNQQQSKNVPTNASVHKDDVSSMRGLSMSGLNSLEVASENGGPEGQNKLSA